MHACHFYVPISSTSNPNFHSVKLPLCWTLNSSSPSLLSFIPSFAAMTVAPLIDSSWHRLESDSFGTTPSLLTPLDPSSSTLNGSEGEDEDGSDWSYSDSEELVTLDLGTDRIARRSLLGYSAGLDTESASETLPSGSSSRTIRSSRVLASAASTDKTPDGERSKGGTHLCAGKMLSITGLDTAQPLLKIDDTILRGHYMNTFGSEIVLQDSYDPTRPPDKRHRLQPIPPTTGDSSRANAASSTTRKRIIFRPIYDPTSRETGDEDANFAALRKLVPSRPEYANSVGEGAAGVKLSDLMGGARSEETADTKLGRGKHKRKELSESEQMIRAAERKVRRAAKEHAKQKEREEAAQQQESAEPSGSQQRDSEDQPPSPQS